MEQTLVLIKPDGVRRKLVGDIINRYEKKGLKIVDLKLVKPTEAILEKHYNEHKGKSFYPKLIEYMMSGVIISIILEGEDSIEVVRKLHGNKDFTRAELGSIRGDFAYSKTENLVHASDSKKSAEREISIWFDEL